MPRGKPKTTQAPLVEAEAESPIETSLEILLSKCFEAKATSADVGRLYKLKDSLLLLNWESPESEGLQSLLVACFESRVFYKSAQGMNFLALAYNLHPLMVVKISEVLKRRILVFPQALVQGCSQVLLKAWQSSSGGMRLAIEQSIIEWMRRALFSSTRVAERVRFLLSELHLAQRTKEIDDILSRYYGPILFRHTKVANWEVRFNAIALLCAAFPVMPPDRTAIEFEEKLTAQFRVLKDAMEDPNEGVRKCAVVGTGRIVRDFWEVLSIEQIALVLDCVVEKAGRDKNSVKTRMSSIGAISLILDNPLSHGVMAELLPSTKNLLNDECVNVRLKYAELLLKISKFKTISIPRFIDQGQLFSRIATDHGFSLHHSSQILFKQTAELLTSLVAPSLFASSVEDQVVKAERMAESIPQGFLALMSNCHHCTSELDRVRLSVALVSKACASSSVPGSGSGSGSLDGLSVRKKGTCKILFRGATELMRSTRFAAVQGTEDKFPRDSDEGKLCAFIYRHVSDREYLKFFGVFCTQIGAEFFDWLSILDGNRLPLVFNKLEEKGTGQGESFLRLKSAWNCQDEKNIWKSDLNQVARNIELALSLDDLNTLTRCQEKMKTFALESTQKLPFIPSLDANLLKLCLCGLLKISTGNDLISTVIHPVSLEFIASFSRPPPNKSSNSSSKRVKKTYDIDFLSDSELANLTFFYLKYLLLAAVLTALPIRASKFEEVSQALFSYLAAHPNLLEWSTFLDIVKASVETHPASSFPALSLVLGSFPLVTASFPQDESMLDDLCRLSLSACGFHEEFSALITKLAIEGTHERIISKLKQRIDNSNDYQVSESLRSAVRAS